MGFIYKHIFISHAWRHDTDYNTVVSWLDDSPLLWRNFSVPEHDPIDVHNTAKLSAALTEQIRHAEIVIIIGGMYGAHSNWIQYELEEAYRMSKKIILIRPRGQERMPEIAQKYASTIVNWNSTSLIDAIRYY